MFTQIKHVRVWGIVLATVGGFIVLLGCGGNGSGSGLAFVGDHQAPPLTDPGTSAPAAGMLGPGAGGNDQTQPIDPGTSTSAMGRIILRIRWPELPSVTRFIPSVIRKFKVTVTGPGIASPITKEISHPDDSVTLRVPAGTGRRIEALGQDADGETLIGGSTEVTVQPNATVVVRLPLIGFYANEPANNSPDGAIPIPINEDGSPSTVTEILDEVGGDWFDYFKFDVKKDQSYTVQVTVKEAERVDSFYLAVGADSVYGAPPPPLTFTATEEGTVFVLVADNLLYSTDRMWYAVTVTKGGEGAIDLTLE